MGIHRLGTHVAVAAEEFASSCWLSHFEMKLSTILFAIIFSATIFIQSVAGCTGERAKYNKRCKQTIHHCCEKGLVCQKVREFGTTLKLCKRRNGGWGKRDTGRNDELVASIKEMVSKW